MSHGGLGQAIFDWGCCRIADDDSWNRDDGARTRRYSPAELQRLKIGCEGRAVQWVPRKSEGRI